MRPRQVVQPGFALVGIPFPVVSDLLPVVSDLLALVGVPLAAVGPPVLRGTGTAPRAMLCELHPSRMRLSHGGVDAWAGSGLVLWLAFAGIDGSTNELAHTAERVG